jgi:hypothetical protein
MHSLFEKQQALSASAQQGVTATLAKCVLLRCF